MLGASVWFPLGDIVQKWPNKDNEEIKFLSPTNIYIPERKEISSSITFARFPDSPASSALRTFIGPIHVTNFDYCNLTSKRISVARYHFLSKHSTSIDSESFNE